MSNLRLADVFTDHMILQRDMRIPIWGTAVGESKITIEFCGQIIEALVVNEKWCAYLKPLKAGGPFEMKINSVVTLKNVLVGEVFVAGGQSNMQFILKDSLHGDEVVSNADFNEIRYYDVPRIEYEDSGNKQGADPTGWQICNPDNAGAFSAVAYYFSKKLHEALKVPIGIISCNWGGTSASCWMSEEYIASDENLKVYLDEYHKQIKNQTDEEYNQKCSAYYKRTEAFTKKVEEFKLLHPDTDQGRIEREVGNYPWPPPMGRKSFLRPAGLYDTMLKKVIKYGIRAIIFYQGESDTHKPQLYKTLFEKMIQNWRKEWGNQNLTFIFTQLPFYNDKTVQKDSWAYVREAQLQIMKKDKNIGMAVITDCGEEDNIHPINKKPVGERLALTALNKIYGYRVICSGPIYHSYEINGNRIIVNFVHSEGGLLAKGGALKGFTICGSDGEFVAAEAEIKGNSVEVSAKEIDNPIAVRYGWANYSETNLYNADGLPASPFRTDKDRR